MSKLDEAKLNLIDSALIDLFNDDMIIDAIKCWQTSSSPDIVGIFDMDSVKGLKVALTTLVENEVKKHKVEHGMSYGFKVGESFYCINDTELQTILQLIRSET